MSLTSEIIQRLSADNSNYRTVMNQSEFVADKTGKSILKKLDLRAGVTAIAAFVGFSFQSMAEGIARAWAGMSKNLEETYQRIGTLTVAVTEKTISAMRAQASVETKYQLLLLERERILKRLAENRTAEGRPDVSFWSKFRTIPMLGNLRNPFYDAGKTSAEEGGAIAFESKEKEKARLTELSTEILSTEKEISKEAEKQNDALKKQKGTKLDISSEARAHLKTEIELTEQMRQQQAAVEAMNEAQGKQNMMLTDTIILMGKAYGASHDPTALQNASDATLMDLVAKNTKEIALIESNKGRGLTALADAATGYLPQGIVQSRLQTDINRANLELQQRAAIRTSGRGGFSGDPLDFEAAERRASNVGASTDQRRIADGLDKLNQHLRRGLPVKQVANRLFPHGR